MARVLHGSEVDVLSVLLPTQQSLISSSSSPSERKQILTHLRRRVEDVLNLLHPFRAPRHPERSLNLGSVLLQVATTARKEAARSVEAKKRSEGGEGAEGDRPSSNNGRDDSPDVEGAVWAWCRDGDRGVGDGFAQRH